MRGAWTSICLAAALLTGGCLRAQMVEGNPIPREHLSKLQAGVTTKQEVLDWFGAPQSFTDLDVLHRLIQDTGYVPDELLDAPYADVLVFQLTRADIEGLVLVLYNHFDATVTTDRLIVFFDEQDHVLSWGFREGIVHDPDEEADDVED